MDIQSLRLKFMQALVTTLRQISIYPPRHPSIVASLNNVVSSLNLIFMEQGTLNANLSPDKALFFDGQPVAAKDMPAAGEFVRIFDRLGVEDISFSRGIDAQELDAFIQLIVSPRDGTAQAIDMNKTFAERGITHITVRQVAYLKVDKGTELLHGGPGEELKQRIKAYTQGGMAGAEKELLEKDLFAMIAGEIKEKGKPSASSRNLLRKYLQPEPRQEDVVARLRQVLAECNIAGDVAEAAVAKLTAVPEERAVARKALPAGSGGGEELRRQVEDLKKALAEKDIQLAQLEQANRKASDEKHRIDNIIHNLAEGMVVVDSHGKILLANTAAEELLGITEGDVGKQVQEVVRDEHLLTMTKGLVAEKDGVIEKDIEFAGPSEATKKILRASSAVVEDKDGNTIGMVTMLNDVTRQKELEKMKKDFLANVTHELRTPLVAVEKSVSLMLNKDAGEISTTQQQFLSIAERNLKRLTFLINDLLDLAKVEAGRMELRCERTDLDKLIADCTVTLENWAHTKELKIERRSAPGLPAAWADPNRLTQVLVNLIGNAIKFTPQGGTITVSASNGAAEGELKVAVEDTGVGIPPEELGRIFDKFYQVKQRSCSDISGTGIGLAIVKEIVALHGGKVWAESDGKSGARFIFTLKMWDESLDPLKEARNG